jgi:hypothetical protein
MSLTLARLCGEWRLVSENHVARSGKYEARIVIFRIPTADYLYSNRRLFYRGNIAILSGKYKARISIFRIFAAIDRFSRISQKVESR